MSDRRRPLPTDAELDILRILWERGPSTVREVQRALGATTGYTTALKLLQIMLGKGLVRRDESERAHVYAAADAREETEGRLVGNLLDRAFRGSASRLVMRALAARRSSPQELAEIRRFLDRLEETGR